ncbi:MAG: lipoyl(octanoyl) transferase LipB [Magnetococcus sp. MYC-9]
MTPCVQWCRYDLLDYESALLLQKELLESILLHGDEGAAVTAGGMRRETAVRVILLEHPSVYTIGRSGHRRDVLCPGGHPPAIPVVETDRGGQVTYHGPGQLVIYVIRDLRPHALASVRLHVHRLEEVVMQTLADLGVTGRRDPCHPGVWVGDAKVAALGVRIHRGIAYHGIALNRDPDLRLFAGIIPCGLADRPVTSLARLGVSVARDVLEGRLLRILGRVFDVGRFMPPLPHMAGIGTGEGF